MDLVNRGIMQDGQGPPFTSICLHTTRQGMALAIGKPPYCFMYSAYGLGRNGIPSSPPRSAEWSGLCNEFVVMG